MGSSSFNFHSYFRIGQTWSETKTRQILLKRFFIHSPAHASFYTSPKEAFLACPLFPPWNLPSFTVEWTLFSSCSRSDLALSRQGAALAFLESLPSHDLLLWTDGSVPFSFGKGGSGVLANCSLCGTEALSFLAGAVCSSFSAEACAIRPALCWSRQHQQVCHLTSLLFSSSLTLALALPPYPLLHFSFISNSVADLAGTIFSLLLLYLATMGPRTFISPGERCG